MTRDEFDALVHQGRRFWRTQDCKAMRRLGNRKYRRCLAAAIREERPWRWARG